MSGYDVFAPVYDDWSAAMTEDVAFYAGLAQEVLERDPHGPVVELAVGNGRVAVPVARAIGRPVIGIDASPAMLAGARDRAATAGVELDLRHGDMRDLALEEPASLVYCPFRSLLHLPTWSDRRLVFERVAASLRPGGRFAWNAFVFDPAIASAIDGLWRDVNGVRHRCDYANGDNRVDVTLAIGGAVSLWWLTRSEWDALLDVAGLELEALYGWFDRRAFDDASREFVYVARKPERDAIRGA